MYDAYATKCSRSVNRKGAGPEGSAMTGEARARLSGREQSQRHRRQSVPGLPVFPAFQCSRARRFCASTTCPGGAGRGKRAKQSQLAEGRVVANFRISEELEGTSGSHAPEKTKPICRAWLGPVRVGRASPLAQMQDVVRGRTTPDQVGGRLYEEAPFGAATRGSACKTKPISASEKTRLSSDAKRG